MPCLRLNKHNRASIIKYARTILDCPKERRVEERAHANALLVAHAYIEGLMTKKEEVVLRKFNYLSLVTYIKVPGNHRSEKRMSSIKMPFCHRDAALREMCSSHYGRFSAAPCRGCTKDIDKCPHALRVPQKHASSYGVRVTDDAADRMRRALTPWYKAKEAHMQARREAIRAIDAVVSNSHTFEQVVELWPQAEAIREKLGAKPKLDAAAKACVLKIKTRKTPAKLSSAHQC